MVEHETKARFTHHEVRRSGFTLVEVMIVVLVLSILMTIAVANFQNARDQSQKSGCISNLRMIEGAKEQWGMELGKLPTATPTSGQLSPSYLRSYPTCPSGGTYTIGDLSTRPTCTVSGHALQ